MITKIAYISYILGFLLNAISWQMQPDEITAHDCLVKSVIKTADVNWEFTELMSVFVKTDIPEMALSAKVITLIDSCISYKLTKLLAISYSGH